ncbi:MAG: hypothetical protein ACI4IV_07820 [Acutalibacteraceae bacterium]
MINLELYEQFRSVPDSAKRPITAGRLKGKTDINPMWRIKKLTEAFGPCGSGWDYEITRKELHGGANGEIMASVDINLFVKYGEEMSRPIPGTGGAMFVSKEKNGMFTDDECFKKALTDAISVACKSLGIGADIYYEKDASKYDRLPVSDKPAAVDKPADKPAAVICPRCGKEVKGVKIDGEPLYPEAVIRRFGMCAACVKASRAAQT